MWLPKLSIAQDVGEEGKREGNSKQGKGNGKDEAGEEGRRQHKVRAEGMRGLEPTARLTRKSAARDD